MAIQDGVVPTVASYIGLPYLPMGRSRAGLDCWGLVRIFYKEQFNIDLPDYSYENSSQAQGDRIREVIESRDRDAEFTWFTPPTPGFGDVVLLRWYNVASHVGVMLDNMKFLHCQRTTGVVMESIYSSRWVCRVEGFYRCSALHTPCYPTPPGKARLRNND